MDQNQTGSAYRAFRVCAYRHKYENALLVGGRSFTFSDLLTRSEYCYNSFRQLGIEPGGRVALWLPHCPDLPACFYGLSRLGAVPVLCYELSAPQEVEQMRLNSGARLLITTPDRYYTYTQQCGTLPGVILCRPELDKKGREKRAYLRSLSTPYQGECRYLDQLVAANRYNANETPACDPQCPAVVLYGSSCFARCVPISYLPQELAFTAQTFARHRGQVHSVFVENSFATEGGFLAVHSALCSGVTVLWAGEDPWGSVIKNKPDYLVATEEFFWELRQNAPRFAGKWPNLQGGIQMGKELTPLMAKFAGRAFRLMGGSGALCGSPVPLKVRKEELYFVKDFGVRLLDLEQAVAGLPQVEKCRCTADAAGICLRLQLRPGEAATLTNQVLDFCRHRLNPRHLPEKVEFKPIN